MSEKESELLTQFIEKTNAKKISWEPTAKVDEFVAAYKGHVTFTISKYEDAGYYGDSFKLVMRDRDGREMLSLDRSSNGDLERLLAELYKAAHDSALKVEETIESILQDLKSST